MSDSSRPHQLEETALALVAPGKGILAADESLPTIDKRFRTIALANTEENRRAYREMLFTTPGVEEFLSGVIFFEESLRHRTATGVPFPQLLAERGILPGIKVDKGAKALAGAPGEKVTEGLDGLRERLVEYRGLGARFAKWRAVIDIGNAIVPSNYCLEVNAHALARYAALCVEEGIVPIVEPEVLMDGPHPLERCFEVTERTLGLVFTELARQRVPLEKILLKPNMVLAGKECPEQASVRRVAEETIRCFRRAVPAAVPGCVFLSGGQSERLATAHLNEMNRIGGFPWQLSFSYGRALQDTALKVWAGRTEGVKAGQDAFFHRAQLNGAARFGKYSEAMERGAE